MIIPTLNSNSVRRDRNQGYLPRLLTPPRLKSTEICGEQCMKAHWAWRSACGGCWPRDAGLGHAATALNPGAAPNSAAPPMGPHRTAGYLGTPLCDYNHDQQLWSPSRGPLYVGGTHRWAKLGQQRLCGSPGSLSWGSALPTACLTTTQVSPSHLHAMA